MRRDYQLSEAGLQERIAERLVRSNRRSEVRTDGSPAGDARGLIGEGLSRLRNMGFLTAVKVRKITILSKDDHLFAGYEMDATVSTLVSMVLIPLVLGSILFSHSAFGFYETLGILILLVLTSWGLDVFILIMMLRHEIYQIASEIKIVLRKRDARKIESFHLSLSPEDLLATAYYFERNGLVRTSEAYLGHLTVCHPDSFEAQLAREHLEHLEGIPVRLAGTRTREGLKKASRPPGKKGFRGKGLASLFVGGKDAGYGGAEKSRPDDNGQRNDKRFRFPTLLRRGKGSNLASENEAYRTKRKNRLLLIGKRENSYRTDRGERPRAKALRKHQARIQRRETDLKATYTKSGTWRARTRDRLSRIFIWEGKEERLYKKNRERWLHGPGPRNQPERADKYRQHFKQIRPNWMRSREEKQALVREKRWNQGPPSPGMFQRSRDRWGRWRLLRGKSRGDILMEERRERAVDETPYS